MSLFADNTHTPVRRPGNPHTSVRGADPPYDSSHLVKLAVSHLRAVLRLQRVAKAK